MKADSITDAQQGPITASAEFNAQLDAVVKVTEEMFERCDVQSEHDPEDPDVAYVVLTVSVTGQPSEIVDRRIEWHKRIRPLTSGNYGTFRLSMIPVE